MKRLVDFLNMCLVTNRGCNLRCTHCYIEPELLRSTYGMSEETFMLTYKRMAEVFALSKHLTYLNVEILGGEISTMPYEFWEKMLPFAIRQHEDIAQMLGKPNSMAWCTNMIFQDERYVDLLNSQPRGKDWGVFIPWEPETKRFGSRNKLFPRYMQNVKAVHAPKTLNLIPTNTLVNMPIDELRKFVIDGQFNDISCDMLYPYGSGKAFFDEHQPTFEEVSDFYIRMTESFSTIENLTISPWDEVRGCLQQGSAFNLNGNDVFDVTVEPDGTVVLNSSMTGTEAPLPSRTLHVSDPLWGLKLLFENASQMHVKFDIEQEGCDQCEYIRYCNGGYYHYKYLTSEQLEKYSSGDCPGYKKYWKYVDERVKDCKIPVADLNHQRVRESLRKNKSSNYNQITIGISESSLGLDYQAYFEKISEIDFSINHLVIDQKKAFGLNIVQRLWFYDSIGASVEIEDALLRSLSVKHQFMIARNAACENYACLGLEPEVVWDFVEQHADHIFSLRIIDAISATTASELIDINHGSGATVSSSGLVIDDRNDELFRFVLLNSVPSSIRAIANRNGLQAISQQSMIYMNKLKEFVTFESLLRDRGIIHK
ncbi:radical SAM protein (plasmid) [Pseudomonas sp. FeN3W]|nr:radical SAM protein [Pseudomonas sp. FeN3W]